MQKQSKLRVPEHRAAGRLKLDYLQLMNRLPQMTIVPFIDIESIPERDNIRRLQRLFVCVHDVEHRKLSARH